MSAINHTDNFITLADIKWPLIYSVRYLEVKSWLVAKKSLAVAALWRWPAIGGHLCMQKMHVELQMATVEWRWPFELLTCQDKSYFKKMPCQLSWICKLVKKINWIRVLHQCSNKNLWGRMNICDFRAYTLIWKEEAGLPSWMAVDFRTQPG